MGFQFVNKFRQSSRNWIFWLAIVFIISAIAEITLKSELLVSFQLISSRDNECLQKMSDILFGRQ